MLIWFMFLLYIVLSIYMLRRLIHWLKVVVPFFKHKGMQTLLISVYVFFASTILFGGLLPHCGFQVLMKKLGNYWLGTFGYIIFFMLVAEFIVFIMKQVNKKYPLAILGHVRGYYAIGVMVIVASVTFSLYGFLSAHKLKTTQYNVSIDKEVSGMDSLKIALTADLHLGYSDGCREMRDMVNKLNAVDADIVVIAGDIFDNDYDALDDPDELINILSGIKSKYGTYVTYGNHDVSEKLIGGFSISSRRQARRDPRMEEFLEKCGFNVMQDDIAVIDGKINLIGRLDGQKAGDGTSDRESIGALIRKVDLNKPTIVIQHEPSNLEGVADAGADIMLSGHTHAGQFFPLTIAQPIVWDNYYGMLKKNNMYSFVTSGVGLYGPNMRTLTNAEVMEINVNFGE